LSAADPSVVTAQSASLQGITFVLGGARAGKSAYAETLVLNALKPGQTALYVATAEPGDTEMADRIAVHKARRGVRWQTEEAPLALPEVLRNGSRPDRPILVDCLTLWLSNLLGAGHDIARESDRLVATLRQLAGPVVLVSNEVGLGIVPDNALARAFRDHAGRLHQAVGAVADRVVFVAAGLPLVLKEKP
jgi:adenosylcobinamide kinase/adenosylcobinamide-phosphate guanylyltransferase